MRQYEAALSAYQSPRDGAIPSGNSVEVLNLLRLATLLDRKDYPKIAEQTIRAFRRDAEQSPSQFERLLIGVDFLHDRTLEIALPADFGFEALREKTISLAAKCHGVKNKAVPELTEEFIKKIGGDEMTLETLRDEVRDGIRRRKEQARDTAKGNQVIAHIFEKVEFELPQEVVNREAQRRTNEIAQRAMQQGIGEEELIKQQDEILNSATNQARQNVKVSFILEQVAKTENLEVPGQKIAMALAQLAERQRTPAKKFMADAQKSGLIDNVRADLLLQEAMEFLKDNAAVEETEPEAETCDVHGH